MVRKTDMVNNSGRMVQNTRAGGRIIKWRDKVITVCLTVERIMENGKTTYLTEKVFN